jgi:hypothetical protein
MNPNFQSSPYVLKDRYDSANFFEAFNCFTSDDPTHGFVRNLISIDNSQASKMNPRSHQPMALA